MKKRRILHAPTWRCGPMTYWVHVPTDGLPLRAMTWPYQQKVVKSLKACLADFEAEVGEHPM